MKAPLFEPFLHPSIYEVKSGFTRFARLTTQENEIFLLVLKHCEF